MSMRSSARLVIAATILNPNSHVEHVVTLFTFCIHSNSLNVIQRIIAAAEGSESGKASAAAPGYVSSALFVQYICSKSGLAGAETALFPTRAALATDLPTPIASSRKESRPQAEGSGHTQQETKDDASASLKSGSEEINWDTHPLPENGPWQRRVDKKTGRVFYQNHATRSTQWTHPLQPPSSKQRKNSRSGRHRQHQKRNQQGDL
mmetsp:Transcript_15105/g.25053  ORF Transcript_15105/g.25053 Transcript_15105/m.25053 type:complete len:206 (+) Transcript_15105:294-911(+)